MRSTNAGAESATHQAASIEHTGKTATTPATVFVSQLSPAALAHCKYSHTVRKKLMDPQPVAHELLPNWLFHRLASWADFGVPASCGETWSEEAIMAAIQKGPSKSARTAAAIELMHTDLQEQVDAGVSFLISQYTRFWRDAQQT
jgi:hypothetical protein